MLKLLLLLYSSIWHYYYCYYHFCSTTDNTTTTINTVGTKQLPLLLLYYVLSSNYIFHSSFLSFSMTFILRTSPHLTLAISFSPLPSNLTVRLAPPFNFRTTAASVKTDYCYGFHYSLCRYPSWRQSGFQKSLSLLSVFIWSSRAVRNRCTVQRQPSKDSTG